jgi:multiple antibiotic resistance protein
MQAKLNDASLRNPSHEPEQSASPGTITGVITLAVAHAKLQLPVTALVAVAVATAVMWIVMVLMARGGTHAPGGFLRDTATRFMGLIVAMGVQFALTGVRSFFLAQP